MPKKDWLITITKDANGKLHYMSGGPDPEHQIVNPEDRVSWISPDGQIAILFKNVGTPLECKQTAFAADMGEATPLRKIKHLTGPKPAKMPFPYAVAHQDVNNKLVTVDPDLIIDDPGGGGGAGGGGAAPSAAVTKPAAKPAKIVVRKVVKPVAKKAAKKAAPKKKGK